MGGANFVPLNARTHFSLLQSINKPEGLAKRCKELGYAACGVGDIGLLAGVPPFLKAMKKEGVRGIAGHEFSLCERASTEKTADNARTSRLLVLSKGQEGWRSLVRLSSLSHTPERFYYRPRLSLDDMAGAADLIAVSGYPGTGLATLLFEDEGAGLARTYEEARAAVRKGWDRAFREEVGRLKAAFPSFFLGVQLIDGDNFPARRVLAEALRWVGKKEGVRCVALASPHYLHREDAPDHRVIVCTGLNLTVGEASRKESPSFSHFFRSSCYHLPAPDEMAALHTEDELKATMDIAGLCVSPAVKGKPLLPSFPLPEGETAEGKLKELCREGWRKKLPREKQTQAYGDRVKHELGILDRAGLHPYFLINWDIIRYAVEELGCVRSEGRGSAAGCMVSYLTGITDLDPIEHDLVFSRFYSSSRNVPRHVNFSEAPFDKFEEPKEAGGIKDSLMRLAAQRGKLEAMRANRHWLDELALLDEERVAAYYAHVFENVDVDRSNPQNSFLLFLLDKVDRVDKDRPANIQDAHVEYPDIDNDFPMWARSAIIACIEEKYGKERVSQMATFSRMQGRGALKDVLRAHGRCGFAEMNRMTEHIPDEAAISDELQAVADAGDEPSIIRWALEHRADKLKEWCHINEAGELEGPYATDFAQAIRLEGTKRGMGKHASGVIISERPLAEVAPMVHDKNSDKPMVGVDMKDAADMGLIKLDILGVLVLDRLQAFQDIMRNGVMKA